VCSSDLSSLLAVTDGTISRFTRTSPTVYTAVFTPSDGFNGTATITVPANSFVDAAGNVNALASSLSLSIDTVAPTVEIFGATSGPLVTNGSVAVSFVVNEAVTGFAASDIVVTGGTLSNFSGSGTTYTAVFLPAAGFEGTATIAVPAVSFQDATRNGNLAATPWSIRVDTLSPRVAGFRASRAAANLGIDDAIDLEAEFSEQVTPGASVLIGLSSGGRALLEVDFTGLAASGRYTAQAGEQSSRLTVTSIGLVGVVADGTGNPLVTTPPAQSTNLAGRHTIAVDARVKLLNSGLFGTEPTLVRDAGSQFRTIPLRFSTPVTGVSLAALTVSVDGRPVSLQQARLQGNAASYTLLLPLSRTNQVGIYTLSLVPGAIRAVSNGAAATETVSLHWGFGRSVGMVPSAPTGVTPTQLVPSGRQTALVLGWQAPAGNGGGPVTHYLVEHRLAGTTRWIPLRGRIAAPATTAIIPSVTPNRAYEFRVAAVNAAGIGAYAQSGPINLLGLATIQAITPATPPASRPSSRR